MNLADECLMVPVSGELTEQKLSGIGPEPGISAAWLLESLAHPHRAGHGQEDSLLVLVGPGLEARARELAVSLARNGLTLELDRSRILDLRGCFDASSTIGDHFVAVCVDFIATEPDATGQEAEFDAWYTYEHMGDVSRADGIHRAFRGMTEDEGPRRYWCWYETDDPSVFMKSRKGKAPWGGLWLENIDQSTFRRSYFAIADRWMKE